MLAEFDNSLSTEANASDIERLIGEKFGEIITANTEKKITLLSRNMTNKPCQVNFDETNTETCGCQALQNKKWTRKFNF